jgi:hypothetical protein
MKPQTAKPQVPDFDDMFPQVFVGSGVSLFGFLLILIVLV